MSYQDKIIKKYKAKPKKDTVLPGIQKKGNVAPQPKWKYEKTAGGQYLLRPDYSHLENNENTQIHLCLQSLRDALGCQEEASRVVKQMNGLEIIQLADEIKKTRQLVKSAPKMLSIKTPEGVALACLLGKEDVLHITKLDLRPFGLDIFSDEDSLNVMGNSLTKNTFKNIKVVISVG